MRSLILAVTCLAWPPAAPLFAAEPFTLDTLMAQIGAVTDRRAAFHETKRFAALDGALESTGHLVLHAGRVEKVTDWPQPERLEIDGDRLVLTTGNDPPRVIDMASVPELRTLIDAIRAPLFGDGASLRRAFVPRLSGQPGGWALDLTARDAAAAKFLRGVHLEGHGDQLTLFALTQANGDSQTMVIAGP